MTDHEQEFIQNQIGYTFKNPDLLQQAFTRRSYAKEIGVLDNEVLEFIGDSILGFIVVKLLAENYGHCASTGSQNTQNSQGGYFCEYNEGQLTNLKTQLTCKDYLAQRITALGLEDFLVMNRGDTRHHIEQEASVKEDLFEAITGAVALDSDWNYEMITDVLMVMLNPQEIIKESASQAINYVQAIQDWTARKGLGLPLYHYEEGSYEATLYCPFDGISQKETSLNDMTLFNTTHRCIMKISDSLPLFRGFGTSNAEARKAACKTAYDELGRRNLLFTIKDEIVNPSRNGAIGQLETLARRGYFSMPVYRFNISHDENGNPEWSCTIEISEVGKSFSAFSSSKKAAKKNSAFSMLNYVLNKWDYHS